MPHSNPSSQCLIINDNIVITGYIWTKVHSWKVQTFSYLHYHLSSFLWPAAQAFSSDARMFLLAKATYVESSEYLYSPQSFSVIKSKMAASRKRTWIRFRPPKIRLHCSPYLSKWRIACTCMIRVKKHQLNFPFRLHLIGTQGARLITLFVNLVR